MSKVGKSSGEERGGSSGWSIRAVAADDLPLLYAINEASTPGVGQVTQAELGRLVAMSAATLVAEDSEGMAGFILCLTEGADYASPNYAWISERYPTFAYCDRVAMARRARGRRGGEALNAAACRHFAGKRDVLLCEVNLAPPNPGSRRFHERLGFSAVGEAWRQGGQYGVVYMAKGL